MELVNPITLVTANRLDVLSKLALARAWRDKSDQTWGLELYAAYMQATKPSKGFSENGKTTLSDYLRDFYDLFLSMESKGFDASKGAVPTVKGSITNGAHRLATALALNTLVGVEEVSETPHIYNWDFLNQIGLQPKYRDEILREYLNIAKNSYVFCILDLPAKEHELVSNFIARNLEVLASKSIQFSEIGKRRLMKTLYGRNHWWDNRLIETLSYDRFGNHEEVQVTFVFVEKTNLEEIVSIKNTIREKIIEGNHKKLHSSDTFQECKDIANLVFNLNSIHYLNNAPLGSEDIILQRLNIEIPNAVDNDQILIDGSATLEMYGLRPAADLDFIKSQPFVMDFDDFSCHNREYLAIPLKAGHLIQNPTCYFSYMGFKFLSLPTLIAFKALRGEQKDFADIELALRVPSESQFYQNHYMEKSARSYRRMLKLRFGVESLLMKLPENWAEFIRSSYKNFRSVYRTVTNSIKKFIKFKQ